jgi:hypothetical protein
MAARTGTPTLGLNVAAAIALMTCSVGGTAASSGELKVGCYGWAAAIARQLRGRSVVLDGEIVSLNAAGKAKSRRFRGET